MAAITPIKYAETSTGGVRNSMRDFVSNLPNIYNQYLTILDRNRQRALQDAQFAEGIRQFEETQKLNREQFEAQNLHNLMSNTIEQQKVAATNKANEDNRQYRQDMLDYNKGEAGRRINEKMIDFYLNSFSNPFGLSRGSGGSGGSGGYQNDKGLGNRIQKEIDYYYSLAEDIDKLSGYIAKLENTSNDAEFNEWFTGMPEEQQKNFLMVSSLSGKKLGEKIDYAKLASSLSEQLDKKHSQAQAVYENMSNYIDNVNKSLGGTVFNKPVNLFPEKDPKVLEQKRKDELAAQEKRNAEKMAEIKKAEELRKQIEDIAFNSNYNLSGGSTGKFGVPTKAENKTDAPNIADYLQGLQRTVYDARILRDRGTNPATLGIGNPGDPYFGVGNNVYDPYFGSGNNMYEQYLRALNTGKNR